MPPTAQKQKDIGLPVSDGNRHDIEFAGPEVDQDMDLDSGESEQHLAADKDIEQQVGSSSDDELAKTAVSNEATYENVGKGIPVASDVVCGGSGGSGENPERESEDTARPVRERKKTDFFVQTQ